MPRVSLRAGGLYIIVVENGTDDMRPGHRQIFLCLPYLSVGGKILPHDEDYPVGQGAPAQPRH